MGRLPAAGGVPVTRRLPAALAGAVLVLATVAGCGSGSYAPTPVAATPRSPGPTPIPGTATPAPAATGAAVTAANCLQSYAPQGALPGPGRCRPAARWRTIRKRGRLIAGVSADSLLLGARNPVTGRIEGFDIDVLRAVAQAIFGDPDKVELRVITTADRIPLLRGRQGRHRRPQHDDHLRPVEEDRVQHRVLPLRPEGARAPRLRRRPDWTTSRARRSARPTGVDQPGQAQAVRRRHPRPGGHPHRLPRALPAGRRATPSPATTPCWPAWPRRTPTPRWSAARSPPSPTDSASTASTSTWSGSSTACSSRCARDGRLTAAYDRWLKPALGPAPAPPTPVYGRP